MRLVRWLDDAAAEPVVGEAVRTGLSGRRGPSVRTAEARLVALGRSIAHSFGHLVVGRDSPRVTDDR